MVRPTALPFQLERTNEAIIRQVLTRDERTAYSRLVDPTSIEVDLQRRPNERRSKIAWPTLIRELGQVHAVSVTVDGQDYLL